jgi:dihydropteroate synthase
LYMGKIAGFLGKLPVGDGSPVRVVGIINLSPESFYKGSVVCGAEDALKMVAYMHEAGADAIDVGGMSTAPYLKASISVEEEMRRLIPVVKALSRDFDLPISADTQRAEVARAAVEAGATAINDISGEISRRILQIAYEHDASIIMLPKDPRNVSDPIQSMTDSLKEKLETALSLGIHKSKVLLDPGIGFIRKGRMPWYERDSFIIANLERLRELGRPVFIGVSRKSFIEKILGLKDPSERLYGSLSATAVAVFNGAHVVRTHDVRETIQAIRLAEYFRKRLRMIKHG